MRVDLVLIAPLRVRGLDSGDAETPPAGSVGGAAGGVVRRGGLRHLGIERQAFGVTWWSLRAVGVDRRLSAAEQDSDEPGRHPVARFEPSGARVDERDADGHDEGLGGGDETAGLSGQQADTDQAGDQGAGTTVRTMDTNRTAGSCWVTSVLRAGAVLHGYADVDRAGGDRVPDLGRLSSSPSCTSAAISPCLTYKFNNSARSTIPYCLISITWR